MPAVIALLGPTNTGKTHLAMERLLEHRTGMIGFPLRLLARENYDRLVKARGAAAVALVTGEERIVPPGASYFICTVEAMPLERRVDFLAIDEVQLAADRERGHVFTDRILHARGLSETMLLGADTMRPLLQLLVPEAGFLSRPRLSTLTYTDPKKLTRLPRRSAVVVFSVAELYRVAERVRRETGGVALVFGALSPRTRNAQVGLYQGGEVDHLVATDAIGMGLNLDIDHVSFTSLVKFDGLGPRTLRPAEVAQIAGRAGRYLKDGTFGATSDLGPLDRDLVAAVETHQFAPLTTLFWRNSELDLRSPHALLQSLQRRPPRPQLVRMKHADDHAALETLATHPDVIRLARSQEAVELLWDVCQVPDFRNVMTEAHTALLLQLYGYLSGPTRRLPDDWVAAHVAALDRPEGDVDTLLARISHIRTWTYVSHRAAWLQDARHWQERTRAVEDRLSDALHERLTEQFVDVRGSVLARGTEEHDRPATLGDAGEVLIQGLLVGRLQGFRFTPEPRLRDSARALLSQANRALREEVPRRVDALAQESPDAFALSDAGEILWRGAAVARLQAGEDALAPRVEPLASDLLDAPQKERVRRHLASWLDAFLRARFDPLALDDSAGLPGPVRGLLFALRRGLGTVARREMASQVAALSPRDRQELQRRRVTLGRQAVFVSSLLQPALIALRGLLFAVHQGGRWPKTPGGQPSVLREPGVPVAFYEACGYQPAGARVVRVDRLERLAGLAWKLAAQGPFAATAEMEALIGGTRSDVLAALGALGFRPDEQGLHRRRDGGSRKKRETA
jgi:ATP-dependent RNA helicase SUPV3L1/SUV3